MHVIILHRFAIVLACSVILTACDDPVHEGVYPVTAVDLGLPVVAQSTLDPDDLPRGRKTLRYGVTPYLGAEKTRAAYTPIAAWISKRLGVPVHFVLSDSYDELVDKLRKGDVDIIQLSPLSYVLARHEIPGLRLIASSLSFGAASYSSLLVVRAGSSLRSLRDVIPPDIRKLRERRKRRGDKRPVGVPKRQRVRFGFVHESSASGFLLPYQALLREGVDPRQDLEMIRMGSHEAAIEALIKGDVDMAAVSSGTLNNVRRGVIIGVGNLRILHKAGRVPYDALCTSPSVPESGARKIAAAFGALSTRTEAGRKVLATARGVTGWVSTSDDRYAFMRKILSRVRVEELRDLGLRHKPLNPIAPPGSTTPSSARTPPTTPTRTAP